ncbi:response regulator [Clostridium beijerinckii]|nr:response regulator [Clostridium beijerinckii]NRZ93255.1 response regulator RpfG family c-di-GMP phosphodiesterase [Clostridium beijerinckii]
MENRSLKILAIDDNEDNLILLKALIKDNFPEAIVLTALSGKKAIEMAFVEGPDVILLDIIMPEMDGFEVCRRLKVDNILKEIPVVFLTALRGDKQIRINALECGAEAFLSKPIDESELVAQIRAMVKIKRAYEQKRNEKERLVKLVEEQTTELKKAHLATLQLLEDLKMENELRKESEKKYRLIAENVSDVIWVLNVTKRKITYVSPSIQQLRGITVEEALEESLEKK